MKRWATLILTSTSLVWGTASAVSQTLILSESEKEAVLLHGPWPPEPQFDPSNRVSGNKDAIILGEKLFNSPALSASGDLSCAHCHQMDKAFTDNLPRAVAHTQLDRNTQSLLNLTQHRWFGWGGQSDNLWAQSLLPIPRADEMALDIRKLETVLSVGNYAADYEELFGNPSSFDEEQNLVNVGKALAAYIETLQTGKTPFDHFRDALAEGDLQSASAYPEAAQRGFQIFAGKGKCTFCHIGPLFSNGEFHDAGVPYFVDATRVDSGRFGGIEALLDSPFTLVGEYSDDEGRAGAWKIQRLRRTHSEFGTFRVPTLRELTRTAPYMHNGSLPTLESVVDHYSNIDLERLHADGELILEPLKLNERETADLIAFLQSLSVTSKQVP